MDELDPPAWAEPEWRSYLVTTCHRLRRKPLREFSVEDLRIMIGQGLSLCWLIPLAIDVLEAEPLAKGDSYPGDLLHAVLGVGQEFWSGEHELHARTRTVLDQLPVVPKELDEAVAGFRERAV